jgi:hypothetical protein
MHIANTKSDRKYCDENLDKQPNIDRAVHVLAEKFALTVPHAREVARLAGLGSEARS